MEKHRRYEIDISRKSLELLKTQSGEKMEVFNAINQTLTSGGARLLAVKRTTLDKLEINKRLDTVSNFVSSS